MGNRDSYRDDLDALKIKLEKLFEVIRDDVMIRRVRIAEEEEQEMMKPTDEAVQLWLSKVQAVETEVDDLIRQISQEMEELHPGGFCSRNLLNMPSSYEFEDIVADKLQAVMNLIIEGVAFVVADDEARVVTIPKDEGVAENLPEDVLYDDGTIVGMESIFTKVWRCLEEEGGDGGRYVGIIGLYGMGGVGKTTLLKQIYRNMLDNYGQNNFAVVIWVSVSKELRLEKIQEKIGKKIGLFDKVWKNKNFEDKASDILKILKEKKFVLLMDELWERVDLTKVGVPFPNPENSSKIVFTTRSLEICRFMEADRQFKMNCLSEEEAWKLFETLVGDETLHSHPEQVVDIGRDISKECSGLPLALVSIGRALAGNKTPQEWRDVLGVLTRRSQSKSSISGSDDQLKKDIYYNLKLSYDHLQNDMFKSCLLYCCLFPRNDKISKGHLIDCWIGEGFLDDRLGAQSQGYHIIDVLLSACLLEQEEGDNYVKMHNWIHDMSLWIATEIEEEKRNFFVCTDAGLTEPPQIEKWVNMTRISMTKNGFTNLENAPMCSHLRTLFLNKNKIKMIGGDFFRFMRFLKVLNLSDNELLELPSEISNLVSLQHLDLSRTAIKSLPNQLGALKKLKCLNLEDTSQLYAIPPRLISTLSVLHVLRLQGCGFLDQSGEDSVVCKDAQLLIDELFCLKNLSMLSIGLTNSHALQKLLSSYRLQSCIQSLWLHSLQHPKSIVISISYMNHLKTLRISKCEYLEELEVDFVGEAQAQAISNFYFLDEVIIESCPNLQDLTWLILAPNVKHLEISQCSELEEIIKVWKLSECPELMRNLTPFLKLHFLKLSNLPNLRSIYWCDLLFPDLKDRIITECPKLQISLPPHHFNKDHSKEKITVNVPSGPSGMLVQKIVSSYEKGLSMLMNSNSSTSTSTSTSVVTGGADHQQPAVGVAAAAQPTYGAGLGVESPLLIGEDSDREQELKDGSKKRKATERSTHQVRLNPATGLEGTLDDGFSWRKYGQKDILGAKYPRGYYRCTHRSVQGCWATKQVQRSDEDPMILEITYRGRHTCTQASKTTNNPPENQEPTNMTTSLLEHSQQALLQHGSYQQQQQQHPELLLNLRRSLQVDPNHEYVDKERCKVEMCGVRLMTDGLHLKTYDESEEKYEPHLEESDVEDDPPPKRLKHIEKHTLTEKLN